MKVRRMTLDLRAINRLVQREEFALLFEKAGAVEQESVSRMVDDIDIDGLRNWFQDARSRDMRDMTHRQLTALCQRRKIPNYSRMQKHEMIAALSEIKDDCTST